MATPGNTLAVLERKPMMDQTEWVLASEDTELVRRIAGRDRAAMGTLYERHQRALFSYLLRMTSDVQLAEEILQDTLVAVWQGASGFAGRSTVRTWLIGIARRQAHNHLRKRRLPLGDDDLAAVAATTKGPEDVAIAHARRDEIGAQIGRLSAVHREVLHLAFSEGLSYREMADVLQVPVGTVKSRLSNAKRELGTLLAPTGGTA